MKDELKKPLAEIAEMLHGIARANEMRIPNLEQEEQTIFGMPLMVFFKELADRLEEEANICHSLMSIKRELEEEIRKIAAENTTLKGLLEIRHSRPITTCKKNIDVDRKLFGPLPRIAVIFTPALDVVFCRRYTCQASIEEGPFHPTAKAIVADTIIQVLRFAIEEGKEGAR